MNSKHFNVSPTSTLLHKEDVMRLCGKQNSTMIVIIISRRCSATVMNQSILLLGKIRASISLDLEALAITDPGLVFFCKLET